MYKIYIYIFLFRTTLMAYENFQARGQVGSVDASLCHRHSNERSQPCIQPTPLIIAMPDL